MGGQRGTPPAIDLQALKTVPGLKYGRTPAVESEGNKPLPETAIEAVLPFVAPQVAAMIQIQYHAAMRPAEVTIMRRCDIDMSSPELGYTGRRHTRRRG